MIIRTGRIFSPADDPAGYGLRCMECSKVLEFGDEIAERLVGMIDDGLVVEIVCGACGQKDES